VGDSDRPGGSLVSSACGEGSSPEATRKGLVTSLTSGSTISDSCVVIGSRRVDWPGLVDMVGLFSSEGMGGKDEEGPPTVGGCRGPGDSVPVTDEV
jgi:hypothetical protein